MKLFNNEENSNTIIDGTLVDQYDIVTLEELHNVSNQIDTLVNAFDISSKLLSNLENNKLTLESMLIEDVNINTIKVSIENINMINDMLGAKSVVISTEAIDETLNIAIESIGDTISKGYEAVKKVIAKIIEAIKKFFKKIWNYLFGKAKKVEEKEKVSKETPEDVKDAVKEASDPKASEEKKDEAVEVIIEVVEEDKPKTNPFNINMSIVKKYKGKKAELRNVRTRAKAGDKEAIIDVEIIDNTLEKIEKKREAYIDGILGVTMALDMSDYVKSNDKFYSYIETLYTQQVENIDGIFKSLSTDLPNMIKSNKIHGKELNRFISSKTQDKKRMYLMGKNKTYDLTYASDRPSFGLGFDSKGINENTNRNILKAQAMDNISYPKDNVIKEDITELMSKISNWNKESFALIAIIEKAVKDIDKTWNPNYTDEFKMYFISELKRILKLIKTLPELTDFLMDLRFYTTVVF